MVLVACDDKYAPKQYFDRFAFRRVKVKVVETLDNNCAALDVLARLQAFASYEDDERWLVLDTDHYVAGSHIPSFLKALRAATQAGIKIALSRPCFEFWLLLHHCADLERLAELRNAREVLTCIRTFVPHFDKLSLRGEDFALELVPAAVSRAQKLDAIVEGGLIPQGNTSRVYKIWESILAIEPTALSSVITKHAIPL